MEKLRRKLLPAMRFIKLNYDLSMKAIASGVQQIVNGATRKRVAIFGGSFDPPSISHLQVSIENVFVNLHVDDIGCSRDSKLSRL